MNASGQTDREFIGDNETAITGFRSIRDMLPAISQAAIDIDRGNTGEALRNKLGVLENDPIQRAPMQSHASEAINEQALQKAGQREQLIQNVLTSTDTLYARRGYGGAFRSLMRKMLNSGVPFFDARLDPGVMFNGEVFTDANLKNSEARASAEGNTELVEAIRDLRRTQVELGNFLREERAQKQQRPTVPKSRIEVDNGEHQRTCHLSIS